MEQAVGSDAENKLITILKILSESSEPLGSITIARLLENEGIFLSERAVRYHLKISDERGYTRPEGHDHGLQALEDPVRGLVEHQGGGLGGQRLQTLASCRLSRWQEALEAKPVRRQTGHGQCRNQRTGESRA